jgi:hydrogenase/urease accessory protein HupE
MKAVLALCAILLTGSVLAHEVRPAFLKITQLEAEQFEVLWKQPTTGNRRLPLDPVLPEHCPVTAEFAPEHTGTALMLRWQIECNLNSGNIHIEGLSRTLTDVMVQIDYLDGSRMMRLLRPANPTLDLSDPAPSAWSFLRLGVEHLLFGIDHILFIIGLVLFVRQPWQLVKTVTAFTAAHSITLVLSVLEIVRVPQGPVEAVIALSILFLARELVLPENERSKLTTVRPWLMAFAFGLLHGFGFAGALADIGLPQGQLALSLFLFNVGIELGQLLVVFIMLAGGWLIQKLIAVYQPRLIAMFSWGMGCAAAFWTIDRVLIAI